MAHQMLILFPNLPFLQMRKKAFFFIGQGVVTELGWAMSQPYLNVFREIRSNSKK
jgi:hypothetical protein